MKKQTGIFLPLALTLLLGPTASFVQASGEAPVGGVGEVSFVLGRAWIQHPGGERERVRPGARISAYDTIETSSSGHVHVRFVDDALVSVRPSSVLEVLRYDYDPARPTESAVKFNLVNGVFRQISGDAAHKARENFRLNTPIAAIGVRGTDFVVSADADVMRALVTEGSIVVAPYSSDCLVDALGPCSQSGLEVVGGASQIVQISATALTPVLLPLAPTGIPESLADNSAPSSEGKTERDEKGGKELYADTVTTRAVNQSIAETRAAVAPAPPAVVPDEPVVVPEFTPDVVIAASALTAPERQLVWGRYGLGDTNERITIFYGPATPVSIFDGRKVTVGNNRYAMFRTENGPAIVQDGLGVVAFNLDKAQAQYTVDGVSSLMDVNGGNLNIDFKLNRFATNLNLNHAATGAVELVASGHFASGNGGGYFNSRSATQIVAGAVSLDGTEAGYFFEKTLERGRIDGLTLWGAQP